MTDERPPRPPLKVFCVICGSYHEESVVCWELAELLEEGSGDDDEGGKEP